MSDQKQSRTERARQRQQTKDRMDREWEAGQQNDEQEQAAVPGDREAAGEAAAGAPSNALPHSSSPLLPDIFAQEVVSVPISARGANATSGAAGASGGAPGSSRASASAALATSGEVPGSSRGVQGRAARSESLSDSEMHFLLRDASSSPEVMIIGEVSGEEASAAYAANRAAYGGIGVPVSAEEIAELNELREEVRRAVSASAGVGGAQGGSRASGGAGVPEAPSTSGFGTALQFQQIQDSVGGEGSKDNSQARHSLPLPPAEGASVGQSVVTTPSNKQPMPRVDATSRASGMSGNSGRDEQSSSDLPSRVTPVVTKTPRVPPAVVTAHNSSIAGAPTGAAPPVAVPPVSSLPLNANQASKMEKRVRDPADAAVTAEQQSSSRVKKRPATGDSETQAREKKARRECPLGCTGKVSVGDLPGTSGTSTSCSHRPSSVSSEDVNDDQLDEELLKKFDKCRDRFMEASRNVKRKTLRYLNEVMEHEGLVEIPVSNALLPRIITSWADLRAEEQETYAVPEVAAYEEVGEEQPSSSSSDRIDELTETMVQLMEEMDSMKKEIRALKNKSQYPKKK